MGPISRRDLLASFVVLPTFLRGDEGWMPLFDGRTLEGWKAEENRDSFRVVDGQIAADGPRAHLFYTGKVRRADFKDKEQFMEMCVDRIRGVLNSEPIDIYVNPTFLPKVMAADYDRLWTPARMEKVIAAARKNDVAIEINNTYRIPSPAFIKAAKLAGVKFSFGTNNAGRALGRLEYCVEIVKECGLTGQDIFVPKPDGEKPVEMRTFS